MLPKMETCLSLLNACEHDVGLNQSESGNSTSAPSIVGASTVYTDLNANPPTQYIIDLRTSTDFQAGRIQGARNVTLAGLLIHVKSVPDVSSYNRLVVVCYTGQTSAYATSLLRLSGYSNAVSLKFGMCSWDSAEGKHSCITVRHDCNCEKRGGQSSDSYDRQDQWRGHSCRPSG